MAPEGRKSRLARAAGAEPYSQMRDEKLHAVAARSRFACGGQKLVQKTEGLRPLLEAELLNKCTGLWREAHFEFKMLKTTHVRATFGR